MLSFAFGKSESNFIGLRLAVSGYLPDSHRFGLELTRSRRCYLRQTVMEVVFGNFLKFGNLLNLWPGDAPHNGIFAKRRLRFS